ncbi:MAG: fructoselysine 3-epimerase [Erysipelotrichaceae bacterium]|nr:fructoselysine 3-epimerase [Erysipelotrichaceae bacterium]
MKLGMFTSGYQRNDLEHIFIDAKRFGYDYIELWGGRPHAYAPDLKNGDMKELLRLRDKYGVEIRGYCPEHNAYPYNYMIGSEAQRQDAIEYLKLCFDMAKEMGADYTLISSGHAGYGADHDQIWNRLEKSVRELVDHAEKIGMKIVMDALTVYESNVIKSANDLKKLFTIIDSPNLVGMCDIVPPYTQHESIMDYFDKLGDKMYHLHLIDGRHDSDDHVIPGEGEIPLPELIKELKEINYDKTATIELVTGYINEPRFYARRAIDNVRAMMKDAGF